MHKSALYFGLSLAVHLDFAYLSRPSALAVAQALGNAAAVPSTQLRGICRK